MIYPLGLIMDIYTLTNNNEKYISKLKYTFIAIFFPYKAKKKTKNKKQKPQTSQTQLLKGLK